MGPGPAYRRRRAELKSSYIPASRSSQRLEERRVDVGARTDLDGQLLGAASNKGLFLLNGSVHLPFGKGKVVVVR